MLKTWIVTSSAGKRLIGMGMAKHADVQRACKEGMLVIIAGTTNGYVAEEVLKAIGQAEGFDRKGFCRGATTAPGGKKSGAKLTGDVVVQGGKRIDGKTIFDVAGELKAGDVVLKGGNALDLPGGRAGVLIGHPACGTAGAAIPHVIGKRAKMIVPIGLEKRVPYDIAELADELNAPDAEGPRLLPLPGEVFTELDAIELLTGATALLAAAGGICGAEGCCWIAAKGEAKEVAAAEKLIKSVANEPPCEV